MGAFFLCNSSYKFENTEVENIFNKKGFSEPRRFILGSSTLYLYPKILLNERNYREKDTFKLFAVGTVIYKEKNYTKSLDYLLDDFMNNQLDIECLLGNFVLIFFDGREIVLLNDALNVQHLFTNSNQTFITSSFLAAVSAVPGKITINRNAALEKLITGYIVGEETFFNEITHITKAIQQKGVGTWQFIESKKVKVTSIDAKNRNDNINKRIEYLKSFFKSIEEFALEQSPEIGLSGGYDSRLLYAVGSNVWSFPVDVHTHATEGVDIHSKERKIVEKLVAVNQTPLKIVPTKNMDSYSEKEIYEILIDGLYFFDGRCAYNMGAFSPVYTRKYKTSILNSNRLTLNGLGGEVYRNYYMVYRPFINILEWMKLHVYCSGINNVMHKKTFKALHMRITKKIEKSLGFKWHRWASLFSMKRYYSELRMPECDALNCNAHNQLSFYLTPFIEKSIIEDAYKARGHVGVSGTYQASMIEKVDKKIASIESHYGFPLTKGGEPLKYKIYMFIRGIYPDFLFNIRVNKIMKKTDNNNLKYFNRVYEKSAYMKNITACIEEVFPEINFRQLRKDYAMLPNSVYVSTLLYELKDKIQF